MGSGLSQEHFVLAKAIYEENKGVDGMTDEMLYSKIKGVIDGVQLEGAVDAEAVDVEEDPAARNERNQNFLYACGAYQKATSSAKANLTEASNLWFKGVDASTYVDEEGWTALHHSAGEGHTKIVEFLVGECKVNTDPVDEFNCTPLWVACCNDRRDAVKALLIAGADVELAGKPDGEPKQTPALAARRNRHPGLGDLVDAEQQLRATESGRRERQKRRDMTLAEFNESHRSGLKPVEQ